MGKKRKQKIRENFRNLVFDRAISKNNMGLLICEVCKIETAIDAHHIINRNKLPNGGYVKENGIALCSKCHEKAEDSLNGIQTEDIYESGNLFKIIGSSELMAHKASSKNTNK